jgi:hypothetical protein
VLSGEELCYICTMHFVISVVATVPTSLLSLYDSDTQPDLTFP